MNKQMETVNNTSTSIYSCFESVSAKDLLRFNDKEINDLLYTESCRFLCKYLKTDIKNKIKNHNINENDLIEYIVRNKAWIDMISSERYNGGSVITNRATIEDKLLNELRTNKAAIISDFDNWHERMCGDTNCGMRYGLWQKLINITFKYVYSLHICAGHFKDVEKIKNNFHCPVDTKIAENLLGVADELSVTLSASEKALFERIAKSASGGWNEIAPTEYKDFQKVVKRICKTLNLSSKLYADIIFW